MLFRSRVLSAEHGAEWAPMFMRRMDKMRGMGRNGRWIDGQLKERPSEIFKRCFRVVPYWEDDIVPIVEACGRDVIVGGSDFPHAEGLDDPVSFVDELAGRSTDDIARIMGGNIMELVPTAASAG